MLARPPLLPSDKIIALTFTVFPVPTFLLLKAAVTDCPNVSEPINPVIVGSSDARTTSVPS